MTSDDAPKKRKIGVILPDTKSSARWETVDRKYLTDAFKAAGVEFNIQNAQGDANKMKNIADEMIHDGVNVLMITNLDSVSGRIILDHALASGIATIDYDRLTLGGSAQYYVSFDSNEVGILQAKGLADCLSSRTSSSKPVVAELNGSPTDNNATLFKDGYDTVLKAKYDSGEYVKGPDESVPDWDNEQAATIFGQMMKKGRIDGVLAANDGLANAAISVLKKNGLNGKVPVTGQDATVQGLQHILAGEQCMTVYKAVKKEADAASNLAIQLAKGGVGRDTGTTIFDPRGQRNVPSILLTPQAITKNNVKDVVTDGFVSKAQLCTKAFAAKCRAAGIE